MALRLWNDYARNVRLCEKERGSDREMCIAGLKRRNGVITLVILQEG